MDPILAAAIYFVLWWIVFFALLPVGRPESAPDEQTVAGEDAVRPSPGRHVLRVAGLATIVAAGLGGTIFVLVSHGIGVERVLAFFPGPA